MSTENKNLNFLLLLAASALVVIEFFFSKDFKRITKKDISPINAPNDVQTVKSYHDLKMGIKFDYPSIIGQARSTEEMEATLDTEEAPSIHFDLDENYYGYLELVVNTLKYSPKYAEGWATWLTSHISPNESAESVKAKLEKAYFVPLVVKHVTNKSKVSAYIMYRIDCYGMCSLERTYIIPLNNSKYINLLIMNKFEKIYSDPKTNTPLPDDQVAILAKKDMELIENGNSDGKIKTYVDAQDLIFNSLVFDY